MKRRKDPLASLRILGYCRPHDPQDALDRHLKTRAAFERLKAGEAESDDFDRLAMSLNVAKVRAMEIDPALADEIESAQIAMTEVRERFERIGKWGFSAPQLAAVTHALQAYEAIHDASSPMQMERARQVVERVILKQVAAKTIATSD
jgi:hypothetical protein